MDSLRCCIFWAINLSGCFLICINFQDWGFRVNYDNVSAPKNLIFKQMITIQCDNSMTGMCKIIGYGESS